MDHILTNLREIRNRIDQAATQAGRDPSSVTLIAVTKTVPIESIRIAYKAGVRQFGESRLQEATPKQADLPGDIVWHFIGKLQSNKAKRAAQTFDMIHTLESEAQLRELSKAGRPIDALIEVNIADEPQKSGIRPIELDAFAATVLNYPVVRLRGLMTIGPLEDDPERMRPYFRSMKTLLEKIPGGDCLSMGMSNDFHIAIQEGATHVRIGSSLFGARV